jgi:hypothetical protein
MNTIIPERRSSYDYENRNCYVRTLPNGVVEYYSKEYYNKNFTRKTDDDEVNDILENIQKEILLQQIEDAFKD